MALNSRVKVPMPEKGVIVARRKGDAPRVYHVIRSYRNEKGQPTNERKLIGKLDEASGMLVPNDAYYEFYDFQYAMGNGSEPIVLVSVVVVALLTVVPTYLLRFRLNLVCFTDEEGITLGVDPGRLRFVALGLATTMVIGSIVAVGQVAIVSLAVPYLVRYAFGADMRRQMLGNFFLGSLILLACEAIASLLAFGSTMAPVALIVNLAVVPFFIWMMALQRRSWE